MAKLRIREICDAQEIEIRTLAERTGIKRQYLYYLMKEPGRSVTIKTLDRIAEGLTELSGEVHTVHDLIESD